MIEGIGFGRGLGVLDLNKDRIANMLHLPDPRTIKPDASKSITDAFAPVKSREILGIADELDNPDPQAFDDVVLQALGVKTSRSDIYDALRTLVSIRFTVKDEADEDS